MASLSAIVNRTPTFKVEIFNNTYNPEDAHGTLDADASILDSGWYQIPDSTVGMLRLKVDDSIYKKTIAEFEILQDEQWLYSLDMVGKRDATVSHPVSADQQPDSTNGSKLLIQIDADGYGSPDVVGTVSITGTIDDVATQTEVVTINGTGSYITTGTFKAIDASGITSANLSCHVAVFADVGTPNTRHEIKISCDANSDDTYGLMFAGYMMPVTNKVSLSETTVAIKCVDYTEFLISNEMVLGNRAEYVCSHYVTTDASGSCSESAAGDAALHWYIDSSYSDANQKCYIGDMNTHHPNGTIVADGLYICSEYDASLTPLPYCGYTSKDGYAPTSETASYAPIPLTYTLAMDMIKRMCISLDYKVTSRSFDMAIKGTCLANETIEVAEPQIDIDTQVGTIETHDLIKVDNEWMYITTYGASTLQVVRARQKTVDATHADDALMTVYKCSNSTLASDNYDQIQEAQVSSDIYKTGTSLATIMTSASSDALFVFWVDKFKQLQITELNLANPGATSGGSGSALALGLSDITKVTSVNKSGVINKVVAWIKYDSTQDLYCEMDADRLETDSEIVDADYNTSISLFGLHTEELRNPQLNSVSVDATGFKGFKTFAYNYLKQHAYPKFTQSIVVDSFIPDEHYWSDTGDEPYFTYTDEFNEHIDLLGRQINAPDFNLEDTPIKTFIIESIHYNITETGNFDTRLVMSRISEKGDY